MCKDARWVTNRVDPYQTLRSALRVYAVCSGLPFRIHRASTVIWSSRPSSFSLSRNQLLFMGIQQRTMTFWQGFKCSLCKSQNVPNEVLSLSMMCRNVSRHHFETIFFFGLSRKSYELCGQSARHSQSCVFLFFFLLCIGADTKYIQNSINISSCEFSRVLLINLESRVCKRLDKTILDFVLSARN